MNLELSIRPRQTKSSAPIATDHVKFGLHLIIRSVSTPVISSAGEKAAIICCVFGIVQTRSAGNPISPIFRKVAPAMAETGGAALAALDANRAFAVSPTG